MNIAFDDITPIRVERFKMKIALTISFRPNTSEAATRCKLVAQVMALGRRGHMKSLTALSVPLLPNTQFSLFAPGCTNVGVTPY
jgi:hypothetical protein